jgi:hypothetical protein
MAESSTNLWLKHPAFFDLGGPPVYYSIFVVDVLASDQAEEFGCGVLEAVPQGLLEGAAELFGDVFYFY